MKPLTNEQRRILIAARDGRLVNSGGRWTIVGEQKPDRRERARVRGRGLLEYPFRDGRHRYTELGISDKGREALDA